MNDSRHSSSLFSTPVSEIIEKHPFKEGDSRHSSSLLSTPVSDIIEKHPFKRNLFQSLFPDYDNAEWTELVNKMKRHYDKILIKRGDKLYLPRGTKLYHGDLSYPFVPGSKSTGNKDKMTFFGLDIDISIWYILELVRLEHFKKTKDFSRFGFLYLFTLTEEIEIHKLIDIIYTNLKDTRECNKPGNVCLHPQVAFRGTTDDSPNIYKLSSEVTLHYPKYESQLSLDRVYIVDPLLLEQNKLNREWKVRDSIIRRYQSLDNLERDKDLYSETLDADTYIRYYLSSPVSYSPSGARESLQKGGTRKKKRATKKKKKRTIKKKKPPKSSGARMA